MRNNIKGIKIKHGRAIILGILIVLTVMAVLSALILLGPRFSNSSIFQAPLRTVNTFSYYVLNKKPQFYYLEMEKNGKEIRIDVEETFEITYRDEFVIKSVISDDIGGKYSYATMEGTGNDGNHIGMMFRGIDFVNRVMQSDAMAKGAQSVNAYKITIRHQNEKIAEVPVRVVISAQEIGRAHV
mgnify:CR=1 FL=1